MNFDKKTLGLAVVIVIVLGFGLWLADRAPEPAVISDFESCARSQGGKVQESYPRRCQTADGRTFTEPVTEGDVVVFSPRPGETVTSPLQVTGKARGNWYFEANLPVTLKDQTGQILAQKGFQAKSDWMTTDYVEFEGTLEFAKPNTEYGLLLIEKDNPSGLPEHDASYVVPVKF